MDVYKKIISALCILIITFVFFIVVKKTLVEFNIFLKRVEYYLTIFFGLVLVFIYKRKYNISILCYIGMLFVFLLFREKVDKAYNFDFYLIKWLKMISTNRIVFINIIGNLLLFLPLTILILVREKSNLFALISTFVLVVFLETIQFITKTGVFDVVDILLNTMGILLGMLFYKLLFHRKIKNC